MLFLIHALPVGSLIESLGQWQKWNVPSSKALLWIRIKQFLVLLNQPGVKQWEWQHSGVISVSACLLKNRFQKWRFFLFFSGVKIGVLFGKYSQIIRFTESDEITFCAGSSIWQSLSMLPMLISNAECYIRQVVCTAKKSVSSNLWSWHTSFSSIFRMCWKSHSKLVDAFGWHKIFVLSALGPLRKSQDWFKMQICTLHIYSNFTGLLSSVFLAFGHFLKSLPKRFFFLRKFKKRFLYNHICVLIMSPG